MASPGTMDENTRPPLSHPVPLDVISDWFDPIVNLTGSHLEEFSTKSNTNRAATTDGKGTCADIFEGAADGRNGDTRESVDTEPVWIQRQGDGSSAAGDFKESALSWLQGEACPGSSNEHTDSYSRRESASVEGLDSLSSIPQPESECADKFSSDAELISDGEAISDAEVYSQHHDFEDEAPLLGATSEDCSGSDTEGSSSVSKLQGTDSGFRETVPEVEGPSPLYSREIKESPGNQRVPDSSDSSDLLVDISDKSDARPTRVSVDLGVKAVHFADIAGSSQPTPHSPISTPQSPSLRKEFPALTSAISTPQSPSLRKEFPALTVAPSQPSPGVGHTEHPLAHFNTRTNQTSISVTESVPALPAFDTTTPASPQPSKRSGGRAAESADKESNHASDVAGSLARLTVNTDDSYEDEISLLIGSECDYHALPKPITTASHRNSLVSRPKALSLLSLPQSYQSKSKSHHQSQVRIDIPEEEDTRMVTSLEDITSLWLWKGIVAEFVGVLLLVLVGCGSCVSLDPDNPSSTVQIALCFGLSVTTIVWNIGHISGGHINPAVTLAMLATRRISLAKAIFFVLFQLVGAVVGAGILMGLTPKEFQGGLGNTQVRKDLDPGMGLGVELFITFVLVFTIFASIDSKRRDLSGSTPLAIGLSVIMCHLFAIQYTGASMNTARSFGPALVTGKWDNHWVYWVGPIGGGVLAGLLYEYLFALNASLNKVRACILTSNYEERKFKANKIKVRIIQEDFGSHEEEDEEEEQERESHPLTRHGGKLPTVAEEPSP